MAEQQTTSTPPEASEPVQAQPEAPNTYAALLQSAVAQVPHEEEEGKSAAQIASVRNLSMFQKVVRNVMRQNEMANRGQALPTASRLGNIFQGAVRRVIQDNNNRNESAAAASETQAASNSAATEAATGTQSEDAAPQFNPRLLAIFKSAVRKTVHENMLKRGREFRRKLEDPNKYKNAVVQEMQKKLGVYKYRDEAYEATLGETERREMVELEGGVKRYIGNWVVGEDVRQGPGVMVWADGSIYSGYWKDSKACGNGRLIHASGDYYEGDWVDDMASGKGSYKHADGATYFGDWLVDKQHGKGIEKWTDGASFEGDYRDGKKHGMGIFTWADGSTYNGSFVENNIQGQGTYKWADGRIFKGAWEDNKMHGHGEFTWPDGRRYVGDYVRDKKEGQGTFTWPDGRKFEGAWLDGKQHGNGTYITSNGLARRGIWVNGRRTEWLNDE